MSTIQFFAANHLLFSHTLPIGRILIGRSLECDISLPFDDISRVHCIIERTSSSTTLINRSQFGCQINGSPVQRAMLQRGDTIQLGSCELRVGQLDHQQHAQQVTAKQINPLTNRPTNVAASTAPRTTHRQQESPSLIGESAAMMRLLTILERIAESPEPALLIGESGTGKELAAHAVHDLGPNKHGPFIPINCAAISPTLFESELFGHEKGAFSGATRQTDGAFRAADHGTLFLDEIGELPLSLQAKLLRVLETGAVRRVGSTQTSTPTVRIIAATNRDLGRMMRDGTFRPDLAYRLSILTVRLPALRQRKKDIPALCNHLLRRHHQSAWLTEASLAKLTQYDWPGNVRELRNVLLRAAVLHGGELRPQHLELNQWEYHAPHVPFTRKKVSREAIEQALQRHNGNRTHASKELDIPRSTLLYKMKLMNIHA